MVKVALFNRGMTLRERSERVEGPGTYVTEYEFHAAILLGTVFFRTALPCSGGYHMEMGGMPLQDAVGITVKRARLLKIKAGVNYMG